MAKRLGKREREARKRCKRASVITGAMPDWLKLGHKHLGRWIRSSLCQVSVAEAGKLGVIGRNEIEPKPSPLP